MKSRHILVPLDLVRGPADALVAVQKMAEETSLTVTLLHVVDLNIFPAQPAVSEQLAHESQAALGRLSRLFFGVEHAARIVVRNGHPAEEIIAESKASGAELIVMCGPAPRRMRFLRRGTTQRVVRSAGCPTLVIPHPGTSTSQRPGRSQPRKSTEEACFCAELGQRSVAA